MSSDHKTTESGIVRLRSKSQGISFLCMFIYIMHSDIVLLCSLRRLLVSANDVPNSPVFVTLMMEVLHPSETSILTGVTHRSIPEDDILHNQSRENLKCYLALTDWTMEQGCNMSTFRYEMGFYIPENDILHNHGRKNLKSYTVS
jgi:hypothetical protein